MGGRRKRQTKDDKTKPDVDNLESDVLTFGRTFYDFEAEVNDQGFLYDVEYQPSETVAHAASDVQLLAYAHRDGVYASEPSVLEVPRNTWVLFSKQIIGTSTSVNAADAIAIRVRELYDSSPVVEAAAIAFPSSVPETWRVFPVQNCPKITLAFETLSAAVVFLRTLSQMSSLMPIHQDYDTISMPDIQSWTWVGETFLLRGQPNPDMLTDALLQHNKTVFSDLMRAPITASVRLVEETFTQPHVWIGRLAFKGSRLALAHVVSDSVWILLHACRSWARASYSIAELLASLSK